MRNVCKNVSSRPTDLFSRFCWNDSARTHFPVTSRPPGTSFTQLFSQSMSSHTLCSCLDILSTTNNLCNFWQSNFQQVSTYAFCSWDDIFTQKMELQFSKKLVQVHRIPVHVVDQHLYSMESLLLLKQPSCNVF